MAFRTRKVSEDPRPDDLKEDKVCRKKCSGARICPDCKYSSPFPATPPPPPPPPPPRRPPPRAITNPTAQTGGHFKISAFLFVALGILAPAVVFLTCYAAYKLYSSYLRRSSSVRREPHGGGDEFVDADHVPEPAVDHPIWYIRTVGLDSAAIGAITAVQYRKGDTIIDGTDCAVCLSEFREDETLRLLPKCSHAFHAPCIDTWLRSHTNCPLCRAGIFSAGHTAPFSGGVGQVEETVIGETGDSIRESGDGISASSDRTMRRSASEAARGVIGSENKQSTEIAESCSVKRSVSEKAFMSSHGHGSPNLNSLVVPQ